MSRSGKLPAGIRDYSQYGSLNGHCMVSTSIWLYPYHGIPGIVCPYYGIPVLFSDCGEMAAMARFYRSSRVSSRSSIVFFSLVFVMEESVVGDGWVVVVSRWLVFMQASHEPG